jgi:transcription factor E
MLKLKDITAIVEDMGIELDEQTQEILKLLSETDIISENEIAEKFDIKINAARKSLYKLHTIGFVEYTKEKDAEKKWWYIYFWSLNQKKLLDIYLRHKQKLVKQAQETLTSEHEFAFQTRDGQQKFSYNEALANNFSAPDSNKSLIEINNSKFIKQLENNITDLNTQISTIETQRKEYKEMLEKAIEATLKAEEEALAKEEKKTKPKATKKTTAKKKIVAKVAKK